MRGFGKNNRQAKFEFRPVNNATSKDYHTEDGLRSKQSSGSNDRSESISPKASWKITDYIIKELKKNANKYSILEDLGDTELSEDHRPTDNEIVDKYVKYQRQPTLEESKNWTSEMFKYFKEQWERKCQDGYMDEEDVYEGENAWNVRGMCNKETQKEVKKFIGDEKLSICATLETHIKPKQIDRISSKVFGRWNCRERKDLWKELHRYKIIVNDSPWVLMGDWNVSLNNEDHSEGGSCKSADMLDFQECIEEIEIEDLKSHFLPHQSSDHCPAILVMPETLMKKKRAFRFANFVADKPEFSGIVGKEWNIKIKGCEIYKLVKKLKAMKLHMKRLSWKNGNLFDRVVCWRDKLKVIQVQVDKDPHNIALKTEEANTLKEYTNAMKDEEKFLYQKAEITWMSDGDKNNKFFHAVIKGKVHRNMIDLACDEKGDTFKGIEVAEQFVKHFQNFLGKSYPVKPILPNTLKVSKVTMEDVNLMVRQVTNKEIKEALFDICDNKALDNILLTQELLKGYTWKNGPKRVAMKIDIQKAYDTISWDFLECILKEFDFPQKMINWIMVCVRNAAFSIRVNGERFGYFKCGRGLRQGDPISPYIFTLVMEIFTKIMQKKISKDDGFKYHWGCKELEISYLCFADDLLVMCHGDVRSVKVGKSTLDYFSCVSGLSPNLGKSTIFFGNVDNNTKMKSLTCCLSNWEASSILFGGSSHHKAIGVYWASLFILPKTVVQKIDRLLKGFLWCQGNLSKGKAKVAWKLVSKPKKEGGIGIKNSSVWNEVLMAKHLWNIACNKESLWVKWINVVRLKGTSIWEVKANRNTSCGWKHILSLRSKMRPHVKYEIGNGETALLWHDRCNGKWKWPMSWTRHYPQLNSIPVPNLVESGYKVVWENNNGEKVKFSINIMWKDWVQIGVKMAWYKIVWFSQCTPKHSFILWLTILKRLSTQDKIIKWYPGKQVSCPLCEECPDSHEHLFFKCPYSMKIWIELKKKINMEEVNNDWENILNRVTDMACNNSIRSVLRRVVLAACVYYIWDERNKRLFGNQKRNHEALMQLIINNIRMKLVSLKVKNSIQVSTVSKEWQVTMNENTLMDDLI
ncbi:RNA-directed DNA polymerase, eukaryota, reverse transcriptase zinc-binding domain protein [Tanacetum coccineum]